MKIRIRAIPKTPETALTMAPLRVAVKARPRRVLDFDVECRPLHFYGEYVSKEITAIAWAWCDKPLDVTCCLLGEVDAIDMLYQFVDAYNQADMVTGHYIRGFDLPLINGALTEYQLPALADKLTQDTKLDLVRRHGLSGSQENLGSMLMLDSPKVSMNQARWRSANRLTREGLDAVRERVTGDVKQHMEMRSKLLELGYLGKPVVWKSGSAKVESYTP